MQATKLLGWLRAAESDEREAGSSLLEGQPFGGLQKLATLMAVALCGVLPALGALVNSPVA